MKPLVAILIMLSASAFGELPAPPDGPPAPLLIGIDVSGPSAVAAGLEAGFVCLASYSDGTSGVLFAGWSVAGAVAAMQDEGDSVATVKVSVWDFGDAYFILRDSTGNRWQVTVSPGGVLTTTDIDP